VHLGGFLVCLTTVRWTDGDGLTTSDLAPLMSIGSVASSTRPVSVFWSPSPGPRARDLDVAHPVAAAGWPVRVNRPTCDGDGVRLDHHLHRYLGRRGHQPLQGLLVLVPDDHRVGLLKPGATSASRSTRTTSLDARELAFRAVIRTLAGRHRGRTGQLVESGRQRFDPFDRHRLGRRAQFIDLDRHRARRDDS